MTIAPADVAGMRLPVLRETRMTAVVCALGPVQRVIDATPALADAVIAALAAWALAPVGAPRSVADASVLDTADRRAVDRHIVPAQDA